MTYELDIEPVDGSYTAFELRGFSDAMPELVRRGGVDALDTEHARLLALLSAAPDLLAVCEAIADRYNTDDRLGGLGDMLADAIAKARGR